ncbi:hypothetical protein GCM10022239_03610 [Leifsonia bigeumensis]|uniref:Uncharacterized protein n=1 Tax=Leifsonella bigeumensis TaxID=433643 RepID=A0ABP7F2N4_9MICO
MTENDTRKLIEKADEWLVNFGQGFQEFPGGPMVAYEGTELIRSLHAALEASLPTEDDRTALIEHLRRRLGQFNGTQFWVEFMGTAEVMADEILAGFHTSHFPPETEETS